VSAFITYTLLVIEVILGLMLIAVVLVQKSKDQGLGLAFGSGMGESLFGAKTANVLVKTTIVLAVLFFLCTMALAGIFSNTEESSTILGDITPDTPAESSQ
jgi:preprotein translocase subunit SecG